MHAWLVGPPRASASLLHASAQSCPAQHPLQPSHISQFTHVDRKLKGIYFTYAAAQECNNPQLYAANVRKLMAKHLGVPLVDEDRSICMALEAAGVRPSLDGRRVEAPPGVLDEKGRVDLGPWLQRIEAKKTQ